MKNRLWNNSNNKKKEEKESRESDKWLPPCAFFQKSHVQARTERVLRRDYNLLKIFAHSPFE